jgi:hypothetical protein
MSCLRTAFKLEASPERKITTGPLTPDFSREEICLNSNPWDAIFGPVTINPEGILSGKLFFLLAYPSLTIVLPYCIVAFPLMNDVTSDRVSSFASLRIDYDCLSDRRCPVRQELLLVFDSPWQTKLARRAHDGGLHTHCSPIHQVETRNSLSGEHLRFL